MKLLLLLSAVWGLDYPAARREVGRDEVLQGIHIADAYRWLEDQTSPEVVQFWKEQNHVTDVFLAQSPHARVLRDVLEQLGSREQPVEVKKYGDFNFFFDRPKDKGNGVLFRESKNGIKEVVVDPNPLSPEDTAFVKFFSMSPSNQTLVYGISRKGSDWTSIHVMDNSAVMRHGEVLLWTREKSVTWAKDKEAFFYSSDSPPKTVELEEAGQEAESNYFTKLKRHQVGTSQEEDEVIWKDDRNNNWYAEAKYTDKEEYLLLNIYHAASKNSQLLIFNNDSFTTLEAGFEGYTDYLGKLDKTHLFLTSRTASFGKIIATDLPYFSPKDFIAEINGFGLLDAKIANKTILANYICNATHHLKVFNANASQTHSFDLPSGHLTSYELTSNGTKINFNLTDIFYKRSFSIDLASSSTTQTYISPPLPGFNPDLFQVAIISYTARDGTPIPLTIVHRKGLAMDASHPAFLYAYGGFNSITSPSPQPYLLAMLQSMDMVLAFAHIRGGGENGIPWHRSGANMCKQTSYNDFQDAAIYLVQQNYTQHHLIAINGRSNGGTLAAVSFNQAPSLFGCVVADVGVMDLTRYQLFHDGMGWFEDFGNVRSNATELQNTLMYSPYHNINCRLPYPPILITSGSHDDRVSTLHSLKFAAKLQACQPAQPALLKVTQYAGHGCGGCGKPAQMEQKEKVDMLNFIAMSLNIHPKPL
ncbi:hypothetical protein DSO57_1006263 [Entomophthora muscae]|uniref:Uncharacterized protein n=1 Tax=Entomophthora muscae TaxID=34485 RepID=A0ACC2TUR7_9FUNG|nr:hypothetical protein DSO57_1006263 [Entomophthora muscae]